MLSYSLNTQLNSYAHITVSSMTWYVRGDAQFRPHNTLFCPTYISVCDSNVDVSVWGQVRFTTCCSLPLHNSCTAIHWTCRQLFVKLTTTTISIVDDKSGYVKDQQEVAVLVTPA